MGSDYRTSTGLGKQALGGHTQSLVHTRTLEKGAASPQESEPGSPVRVQGPLAGCGYSGLLQAGALSAAVRAEDF